MKRFLSKAGAILTAAVMAFSTLASTTASAKTASAQTSTQETENAQEKLKTYKLDVTKVYSYSVYFKPTIRYKYTYNKAYIYNEELKKYVYHSRANKCVDNLRPNTEYKIMIEYIQDTVFDKNPKEDYVRYRMVGTVKTAPAIKLINNGKTCNISLYVDKGEYDGVEFYIAERGSDYYNGGSEVRKLAYRNNKDDPSTVSFEIKTPMPETKFVYAKLYKIKNGRKTDIVQTERVDVSHVRGLANNITLSEPRITTSGQELELVKYYTDLWLTDDMTPEEKLIEIFYHVHAYGEYGSIYQIDGNRPVWQIMIKGVGQCATWAFTLYHMLEYAGFDARVVRGVRKSGEQHFWTEIDAGNGQWIAVDAHLGGIKVSTYDHTYSGYIPQEYMG